MRALRVLITNNTLGIRAGSELYVRDLATALLARGHTPIAFSTVLGDVARELRAATVPVVDDLDALGAPPDVIHGQHHLETMTALLRFPGVPAVYFCHGWMPWEEAPPRFPRIHRYVAVDQTCRDRLVFEHGIPEDRVRVLLNFVDLDRFVPRDPLPDRPRRALVFSNGASEQTHVPAARAACEAAGIALDVIGASSGNATAHPETVLGGYDLVFSKGRSAIEALAVGAAVVLCDAEGAGPLVTTAGFDRLRALNFGIRARPDPVTADVLAREITRYDPEDAAQVSRRIRAEGGREATVDEIVAVYREVLAAPAGADEDESIAAARYLRWLGPFLKRHVRSLEVYARDARDEGDRLRASADEVRAECDGLRARLAALEAEHRRESAASADWRERATRAQMDAAHLVAERDRLAAELAYFAGSKTIRVRDRILGTPLLGALVRQLLGRRRVA